jgi:beclin 1
LDSLALKIKYDFKSYRIFPIGSYSKIESIKDKVVYTLYGSNDFTGLFSNRKFDSALVGLVTCLREMGDFAYTKDTRFELPYK